MERFEALNLIAKPVDLVLKGAFDALKAANLYQPAREKLVEMIKSNMVNGFEKNNQLEVIGLENVPEGGAILAANHQSWLDAQVLGSSSERELHFIAKSDFVDWPVLSKLIELTESVYIRRGGDRDGIQDVVDKLKEGWLICIFPEGTIPGEEEVSRAELDPRTGLLPGKSGMIRMAVAAGVPIIPVGVSGTGQAFPPEAYPRIEMPPVQKKMPITIRYGEPIHFDEYKYEDLDKPTMKKLTHKVMVELSKLIDHKRCFVPIEVPMKKPDTSGITFVPKGLKGKAPYGFLGVHGFTSDVSCVSAFESRLKEFNIPYRFPILRGHGTVPHDMVGVTHTDWYNDAEAALMEVAEHADQVIVAGLSMGGLVTLELGMKHPELISNCILIAAALKFADPMSALSPALAKVFKFWDSPNSYNDMTLKELNNRNYPFFATAAFASLLEYSQEIEKSLPKFDRPVLILQSKKDAVVAPKAAEIINKRIKSSDKKLVWFHETNHEMLLDSEADAVMDTMKEYVASIVK